ncbi:uncharacterized protein PGTG_02026 [Puccinia graminis f. sp. tritici CRL 75-36-700-3]|uniref:Uncharacterized protein n=1 Tax=Puccinia graminis f. sp. tritici (strain CRL 75-36-700-3 / race SCCL) TaxID=418459 RepID=E3JWZ0_PUCGT|nr:uncharacterized protein PGTG_02026 [Puccinia graminis f. sp. tritici CRL 75-36-700-3]EFP76565.2 hypothetical protein PGTG_02026 [Puccinia graminis f. sp. tritici CRL 75-36-700-3]
MDPDQESSLSQVSRSPSKIPWCNAGHVTHPTRKPHHAAHIFIILTNRLPGSSHKNSPRPQPSHLHNTSPTLASVLTEEFIFKFKFQGKSANLTVNTRNGPSINLDNSGGAIHAHVLLHRPTHNVGYDLKAKRADEEPSLEAKGEGGGN